MNPPITGFVHFYIGINGCVILDMGIIGFEILVQVA